VEDKDLNIPYPTSVVLIPNKRDILGSIHFGSYGVSGKSTHLKNFLPVMTMPQSLPEKHWDWPQGNLKCPL
jgi:hypothetical protein